MRLASVSVPRFQTSRSWEELCRRNCPGQLSASDYPPSPTPQDVSPISHISYKGQHVTAERGYGYGQVACARMGRGKILEVIHSITQRRSMRIIRIATTSDTTSEALTTTW